MANERVIGLGQLSKSFDNVSAPANGASGIIYALPQRGVSLVTWNTLFTVTPSAIKVDIQISNEGTIWSTVDSSTLTGGEVRSFYTSARLIKAVQVSRTGGSGVTVALNILPIQSNTAGPFGITNNRGQFEVVEDPHFTGAGKPIVRFSQVTDAPWTLVIGNNAQSQEPNAGMAFFCNSEGVTGIWCALDNGAVPNAFFNLWAEGIALAATNEKIDLGPAQLMMHNIGAPVTPDAAGASLFIRNNAGKVELCVLFPTGAVQVIKSEP